MRGLRVLSRGRRLSIALATLRATRIGLIRLSSLSASLLNSKWTNGRINRIGSRYGSSEKDALVGIAERICRKLDVSYFSCRGYTSQSEMWAAGMRLKEYAEERGQTPVIIHLGDHDPSGIDMSRDITDRLELFMGGMEINRIALNMDQVRKYNPPPNPAKITDSRAEGYIKKHGRESWELDALDPKVLTDLIEKTVLSYRDDDEWRSACRVEERHRRALIKIAEDISADAE